MGLSARTGVHCVFLCAGSDPLHGIRSVAEYTSGAEAWWSQTLFRCTAQEALVRFEAWGGTFGNKGESFDLPRRSSY